MQRRQEAPPRVGTRSQDPVPVGGARQRGKAAQDTVRGCEWPVVAGPVRDMRRENAQMKKSDIAAQVADKTSVSKGDAEAAVNAVLGTITDALSRGESVSIAGFGAFTVKNRPARRGRNPRTGETIEIAAATVPSFKAGKTLRNAVA